MSLQTLKPLALFRQGGEPITYEVVVKGRGRSICLATAADPFGNTWHIRSESALNCEPRTISREEIECFCSPR